MQAIKKNHENLIDVAKSICEVDYHCGRFTSTYKIISDSIVLSSFGRDSIGISIIRKIPCNYDWRVTFDSDGLKLYIWY